MKPHAALAAFVIPLAFAAALLALRSREPTPRSSSVGTERVRPSAGSPVAPFAPPEPPTGPRLFGSALVIDGDTIELAGQRIRLHGIDAPEAAQLCQGRTAPYPCGAEATRHLERLVAGRTVECLPRDNDRFGRLVATCFAAGADLGGRMVRDGWALAYRQYSADYVGVEDEARARSVGVWSGTFDPPADWRRGVGRE